jgi:hypothetical protein
VFVGFTINANHGSSHIPAALRAAFAPRATYEGKTGLALRPMQKK